MAESLIGKKLRLIKSKCSQDDQLLGKNLTVIFQHGVMGGDGSTADFIGLEYQGECVLDGNNLRLFYWHSDQWPTIGNDFEVVE